MRDSQRWPAEESTVVPIDPVASENHIKIYKDRDGNWCMGDKRVFFEFNNKEWFVFGFGGQTQLIGLIVGCLEYRITLCGGGLIHCVHVRNLMNRENAENQLKEIPWFELPLDHATVPFFKSGLRTAVL